MKRKSRSKRLFVTLIGARRKTRNALAGICKVKYMKMDRLNRSMDRAFAKAKEEKGEIVFAIIAVIFIFAAIAGEIAQRQKLPQETPEWVVVKGH